MTRVVSVIPARMAATRFPGKPLAMLAGLPMIEHVRRRVALSSAMDDVIVATCDSEIAQAVTRHGGRVVMTADTHVRCTDRVAEAAANLDADIIINVQGDEPLVRPEILNPLVDALKADPSLPCANLMAKIHSDDDFNSHNVVKTVFDRAGNALYFSRLPIGQRYKQLGIIAFRADFLRTFALLEPSPLEALESVDMLRALEHGYKVRMVVSEFESVGVDTPADLERAAQLLEKDDLWDLIRGQ
jgi:3-deoxy-manno-octulosonate cytidylyltransferase (CMP-KDO synthetase)